MEVKVDKKQMADVLIVRTYLTCLGDVLTTLYDIVDLVVTKDDQLNEQAKAVVNPLAHLLKDELARYAGAYQQLMTELSEQYNFKWDADTVIKIDIENEVFIIGNDDSDTKTNEQESGQ